MGCTSSRRSSNAASISNYIDVSKHYDLQQLASLRTVTAVLSAVS